MEIRCSKLSRAMKCPGSLFFKDLPEEPTNQAAEEGTAAGEYLEKLLTGKDLPEQANNGVDFDDDMIGYAEEVAAEIKEKAASPILCETRIDWQTRSGVIIRGQYDVSFIGHDGYLYIDDYKYGWGHVEVFENWQLLGYAIGEVIRRNQPFEKIVLRIQQPRPHHEDGSCRAWTIDWDTLLEYKEKIESHMASIMEGNQNLISGPQCKYCRAAAFCPAINKTFFRGIESVHEFLQDEIDEDELAFQLDLINRIEEVMKIKKDSLTTLALDRMKNGKVIPNWMAKDSYGHRKWKSNISPELIQMLTGKDITEKTMLSPAKAEKIGVPKELMNSMTERPHLGQKLKKYDASKHADKVFGKGE